MSGKEEFISFSRLPPQIDEDGIWPRLIYSIYPGLKQRLFQFPADCPHGYAIVSQRDLLLDLFLSRNSITFFPGKEKLLNGGVGPGNYFPFSGI